MYKFHNKKGIFEELNFEICWLIRDIIGYRVICLILVI